MANQVEAFLKASGVDKFTSEFKKAGDSVKGLDELAGSSGKGIKNFASSFAGLAAKAAKVTAVAGAAFAGFGIKSAADLRVVEAQYAQSFEGVSDEAGKMVDDMSKSFNILPERLKAPMSNFQSYFKGAGMEVNDSLAATEQAMTLAADSSAYYDKSIEDTSASLKGMMMGNYENGDAIGINTNATKIATAYNGKYGGSFDELSDAQKQNYILEYVNDIYALNGVMGQAERESTSFENVFGNLKSSLSTFAAMVLEPFMDPLINAMQKASEWISGADEKFFAFMETIKASTAFQSLKEVIQLAIDKVKEFGSSETWATIQTAFADLGQAILDIDFMELMTKADEFLTKWGPLIVGVTAAVAAFKAISGTITLAKNSIALFNGVIALAASPIGLAALAIGALIAIGILLWQNWDTIKEKLTELKDKFIADWEELKNIVGTAMTTLKDAALEDFNELKDGIILAVTTLKDAAIEDFNELKTIGSNAIQTLKDSATEDAEELKTGFNNSTKTLKTAAISDFNELKTIGSNAIETLKTAAVSDSNELKTGAGNAFRTLKNAAVSDFNELKNGVVTAFSSVKNTVTTKASEAKNSAITAFNNLKNGAARAWETLKTNTIGVFNSVKTTITGAFDGINLFSAGKAIIDGFLSGLKNSYEKVKGFVGGIAGWIEDHKGPIAYDKKLLIGAGNAIMSGLDKGLKTSFKDVQSSVGGMADQLSDSFNGSMNMNDLDIAGNTKNLNGSISQSVNHIVSDNLTSGKQPAYINFSLGGSNYRGFVDDISNTQNKNTRIEEIYAL